MSNGLLHLPSRQLLAHSARYFTLHSLPFAYDEDAMYFCGGSSSCARCGKTTTSRSTRSPR